MEKSKDQTCPFVSNVCSVRLEKPEHIPAAEDKPAPAKIGSAKTPGQMPWSIFGDVYWI